MNVTVIRNDGKGIRVDSDVELSLELLSAPDIRWIDFHSPDRSASRGFGELAGFSTALIDRLQRPGETFRLQAFEDRFLLDVHIFDPQDIDRNIFFTFVFHEKLIISFSEFSITSFTHFMGKLKRVAKDRQNSADLLAYFFNHVIDDDLSYARSLRNRIDSFAKKVMSGFDTNDSETIGQYKDQVERFESILEDQFLSIGLIPEFSEAKTDSDTRARIDRIASHVEHIQKMMERAEDKLDFVLQQFQGSVQETTNRRINTLTILQSIFVPLTFIAGIYGMNFTKMPELEWANGYFYALGFMGLIALGELWIFWRSGWFK